MTKDTIHLEMIRKRNKMTIVAFVAMLPIQRSTFYGWLKGQHEPDIYRMRECLKIAAGLK